MARIVSIKKLKKTYSYQKEDVSLEFTLSPDNKEELLNFTDLLNKAIIDVNDDIDKYEKESK